MATNSGRQVTERGGRAVRRQRLPPDIIEDVLASPRRRRLLGHLAKAGEPVAVDDLARTLAGDRAGEEVAASDRRRARTELYQTHLTKLTATGVVAFDSRLGTVTLRDNPALAARLEAVADGARGESGTKDK